MTPRYATQAHPAGVLVLDQVTGELTLLPADGRGLVTIRAPRRLADHDAPSPALAPAPEGLDRLPLAVAAACARASEAADPGLRCHRLAEACEAVVHHLALVLAADYVAAADVRDPALDETRRVLVAQVVPVQVNGLELLQALRCQVLVGACAPLRRDAVSLQNRHGPRSPDGLGGLSNLVTEDRGVVGLVATRRV